MAPDDNFLQMPIEAKFAIEFRFDTILTFFDGNILLTHAFQLRLKTRNGAKAPENAIFSGYLPC